MPAAAPQSAQTPHRKAGAHASNALCRGRSRDVLRRLGRACLDLARRRASASPLRPRRRPLRRRPAPRRRPRRRGRHRRQGAGLGHRVVRRGSADRRPRPDDQDGGRLRRHAAPARRRRGRRRRSGGRGAGGRHDRHQPRRAHDLAARPPRDSRRRGRAGLRRSAVAAAAETHAVARSGAGTAGAGSGSGARSAVVARRAGRARVRARAAARGAARRAGARARRRRAGSRGAHRRDSCCNAETDAGARRALSPSAGRRHGAAEPRRGRAGYLRRRQRRRRRRGGHDRACAGHPRCGRTLRQASGTPRCVGRGAAARRAAAAVPGRLGGRAGGRSTAGFSGAAVGAAATPVGARRDCFVRDAET